MSSDIGLTERVHRELRAEILQQRLLPGARLSVPAVASRFGVSRSPAREAITRIVLEGLAEFAPNKGAVVAQYDRHTLLEIYEVREVLEGLACSRAAAQADERAISGLQELLDQHAEAIAAGDMERHYDLDQTFHERIRQIAGNARLEEQLALLQRQIRLAMHTTRRSTGGPPLALEEHRRIVAAVASGDPAFAEQAGRAHIRRLLGELHQVE